MAVIVGVVLIGAGLALAGYIAYEVWASRPGPRRTTNTPEHWLQVLDRLNDTEEDDE